MKRLLILTAACFLALSCETEQASVNNVPEDNLVTNTALKSKLLQVLQSPTAADNFIDGSGCFALQFPYTVVANGQEVNLGLEADYAAVHSILDAGGSTVDVVTIQFPITVTYADYTEATFSTQAQFDAAVSDCSESTELSCMDFSYPVGIKTYNSNYQLAESFDINTKEALFGFLNNLEAYDAVVLDYPVIFNTPDGTAVTISNNQLLEEQIDTYTQQCLDALNPPEVVLGDVIVQGTWQVAYFFEITDQTTAYAGYNFAFNSNGAVQVTGSGTDTGTWLVTQAGEEQQLGLTFASPPFSSLSHTWNVVSLTTTTVQMELPATGVEPQRLLTLAKN